MMAHLHFLLERMFMRAKIRSFIKEFDSKTLVLIANLILSVMKNL